MTDISGSKFSIRLPQDLIIKLEAEKETIGMKSRSSLIEKCVRYYFENKKEDKTLSQRVSHLEEEIEKIKTKVYLV